MEAGTNRSAQDWFRLMVDMGLAPGLRAIGFTGAGRRFRRELDRHWAEIAIIQSPSLTDGVRFTLLLRVLRKDEWTEQLRVRPYSTPAPAQAASVSAPASPAEPHVTWESPLGALVTVGGYAMGELWWDLEVGQPFDALAREVLTVLCTFGLPAITQHTAAP
ncbi:MAG: hypothetical protein ACJ72N_18370 [Labedaea sp.]